MKQNILSRHGNKARISQTIEDLFTPHEYYYEPYFGGGGLYFNLKKKPKHALVNDLDNDVFNFFIVIQNHRDEFISRLIATPIHASLYYSHESSISDIDKAILFWMRSTYCLYGRVNGNFKYQNSNKKRLFLKELKEYEDKLTDVIFHNMTALDFIQKVIPTASFRGKNIKNKSFIYCDPPYYDTHGYKKLPKTNLIELDKLFNALISCGINFAVSESSHNDVVAIAKSYGLFIHHIKNKIRSICKTRDEILITNYVRINGDGEDTIQQPPHHTFYLL